MGEIMKTVVARAPCRIGLAGGGSDLPSIVDKVGGAVVNLTIGVFSYAYVETSHIDCLSSYDQEIYDGDKSSLPLHAACIEYFRAHFSVTDKVKITSFCEAPMGSGLGGSSSLTVAIIAGLGEFFAINLTKAQIALIAIHVEREICGFAGGLQDQYAAAYGGVNYLQFTANGNEVTPLNMLDWFKFTLETGSILIDLNASRHSSKIITEQITSAKNSTVSGEKFLQLREQADRMRDAVQNGNVADFQKILQDNWEIKRSTSVSISNTYIESILEKLQDKVSVKALKLCGAGGGGHLFVMFDPKERNLVSSFCSKKNLLVRNVNIINEGVKVSAV